MVPTGALRFDGFPGGHADFGRGNPSLSEKALDKVVITKVPFASFDLDVVEDEAPQNVQGLPWKSESARVVGQVPGLVFLSFASLLAQEDEGPVDVELSRGFPFLPNSLEGFPSFKRFWAVEQTMLRRFFHVTVAGLAMGGDPHLLEPSAHR
jgi:hypothetical protein